MTSVEIINSVEQQFLKLLSAKGFNLELIKFDHTTPLYISVMYCCNHLFIIKYSNISNSEEWESYKIDLINSIDYNKLCTNHKNGKKICIF